MEIEKSLIKFVKESTITDKWTNGLAGYFEDIDNDSRYRFVECTPDGSHKINRLDDERELPVLATGFVGYMIKDWGKPAFEIYERYLSIRMNEYKGKHLVDPDAPSRNLEEEYLSLCLNDEREWFELSKGIYPWLTSDDVNMIEQYFGNYVKHVEDYRLQLEESHKLLDSGNAVKGDKKKYDTFKSYLLTPGIEKEAELRDFLIVSVKDVSGKTVGMIIQGLSDKGYILIPPRKRKGFYRVLNKEFKANIDLNNTSGVDKYVFDKCYVDGTYDDIMKIIP